MNLFEHEIQSKLSDLAPLASRVRPRTLKEFVGQDKIIGEGKALRRAISEDKLYSLILWGPPGTGKTTLAQIVASITKSFFVQISAVTSNVAEIRKVLAQAEDRLAMENKKTILFIDEIHRFNKSQQDALLHAVEDGLIILVGATTENPYFEVNPPLVSRSWLFQFESLSEDNLVEILTKALRDKRGLGDIKVEISKKELRQIANIANGDARTALNILEAAVMTTSPNETKTRKITKDVIEDVSQRRKIVYGKKGDAHYDTISAFIKSIRGSDPDAALYWLAKMIYAGEDPKFIARRMIIAASEDIGLANSRALEIAVAASRAVEFVGLPEARLNLAHAALYLSLSPKSNSVITGIDNALGDVKDKMTYLVPKHLRDSHYPGAKKLGHGDGYKYPHNFSGNYVEQDYLPKELKNEKYYQPSNSGQEKKIREALEKRKKE
ncbi:replication-associated recombination protein A [Candidatus Oleimmundimicrobium sp.]|uniref:replication-associated recombination protein A n=1 Tax=Candidatus Oleimmundimicrobium sp. TaxID=3060597 RepID=UPI002725FCFD|nr:replication-associated recombination protein A [Candidatus Oleimmundimicrobium sp.]MDO8886736.1 replication-associated recombination protein A [Candidatus Oleimmundimicrobium sp.]